MPQDASSLFPNEKQKKWDMIIQVQRYKKALLHQSASHSFFTKNKTVWTGES